MQNTHFTPSFHTEASHKEISVDQKLELIRQVRSQYRQNQNDLMHRESILYDRPIRPTAYSQQSDLTSQELLKKERSQTSGTFKLRCILALLLAAFVILCHRTQSTPAGINMEQVFRTLEQDYEEIIMSWSSSLIKTVPVPDSYTTE